MNTHNIQTRNETAPNQTSTLAEHAPTDKSAIPEVRIYEGRIDGFEGKTSAQILQELIDREEYRELTAIYALRVGHGISNADLFTDDGVFTVQAPGRPLFVVGGSRPALEEGMKALASTPQHPLPQAHNHVIKVEGDHAVASCSNEVRAVHDGTSIVGSGWYSDVLRRVNGRWFFVRRDTEYKHYVPLQQGWASES